jgi:hypothetical protein
LAPIHPPLVAFSGPSDSFVEKPAFYQGTLVQRQSYRGDYICPRDKAIMSVGDGTNSNTRVTAARAHGCLWPCLIMPGVQCCYLSWARPYQPFPMLKVLGYGCWGPEYGLYWVMRRVNSGLIGGEILLARAYREEMEKRVVSRPNSF